VIPAEVRRNLMRSFACVKGQCFADETRQRPGTHRSPRDSITVAHRAILFGLFLWSVAVERAVTIETTVATPTAVIAETTTWQEFPQLWRQLLDEVWAFVRSAELDAGRNVMLYKDGRPSVEVGVEVRGPFAPGGRVVPSELPAGTAAKTIQRGPPSPEGIADAHEAVTAWCAANGIELEGTRWEVYGHWDDDAAPADYEVEIYWLVRPNGSSAASVRSSGG
jgi:effector-binding domain-containing protein